MVLRRGKVCTRSLGTAPNRSFVIEWRNVLLLQHPGPAGRFRGAAERGRQHRHPLPQSRRRSAGARQLGDGRHRERRRDRRLAVLVQLPRCCRTISRSAFVPPPTGTIDRQLTDANDGGPIAGGDRARAQGTTVVEHRHHRCRGNYSMRLKLGAYTVEASQDELRRRDRAGVDSTPTGSGHQSELHPGHGRGAAQCRRRSPSWPTPTSCGPPGSPWPTPRPAVSP